LLTTDVDGEASCAFGTRPRVVGPPRGVASEGHDLAIDSLDEGKTAATASAAVDDGVAVAEASLEAANGVLGAAQNLTATQLQDIINFLNNPPSGGATPEETVANAGTVSDRIAQLTDMTCVGGYHSGSETPFYSPRLDLDRTVFGRRALGNIDPSDIVTVDPDAPGRVVSGFLHYQIRLNVDYGQLTGHSRYNGFWTVVEMGPSYVTEDTGEETQYIIRPLIDDWYPYLWHWRIEASNADNHALLNAWEMQELARRSNEGGWWSDPHEYRVFSNNCIQQCRYWMLYGVHQLTLGDWCDEVN
jgi:hypothetical protein